MHFLSSHFLPLSFGLINNAQSWLRLADELHRSKHYRKHLSCRVSPTFAVGKISGTRQTWCLPSVPNTTLGKTKTHGITIYAECWHSANNRHTATSCPGNTIALCYHFAECHPLTHGKPTYMPSVKVQHSANPTICRVSEYDTRQTIFVFLILPPKLFVLLSYNTCCSVLKFCTFLSYFTIFRQFILVKWIFGKFFIWTASASNIRKKWIKKWYSCHRVCFETVSRARPEISNIVFTKHEQKRVAEKSENSIKSKRSLKIMKFVELSWYHTWRLW